MSTDYNHGFRSVYRLTARVVFVIKYRRKTINNEILARLKHIFTYNKPYFWTGAYFVASCGGVTVEQLKKYVENQNSPKKDQGGNVGNVKLAFVITNKTSDNLYLGLNDNGGTITDNFGEVCNGRGLQGLATVGSSANTPDDFTLISPNSTLTVGSSGSPCNFPTSTEFNASFPLVRYQASTTNPAGEQTKLTAGFTGLKLP